MVRVRYAPSPTGFQHIGGVRTALYNYFFAKSQGGKFIVRVEDTDRERYSDEYLKDLYDTLDWLGIKSDEGPTAGGPFAPYIQSERLPMYQQAAHNLVKMGKAYYCFCSPERLEQVIAEQKAQKKDIQGYDRHCASLSEAEALERISKGEKYVIRLRVPETGESSFDDLILGRITRKNRDVPPDPILLKSDGYPTYHLANVVDDHDMQITHIMRAQEWIASTPLHILIYDAFGWTPPMYCHLPMVMGSDGLKLSKRHGSTSLREFKEQGYLKEALINYVTLVGWSYDDKTEFFSMEMLEKCFDIKKIHTSPAVFDYKKLDWFNGQYIRMKSSEELASLILPYMKKAGIQITSEEINSYIPLIKERIKVLSDAPKMLSFFFSEPQYSEKESFLAKKQPIEEAVNMLRVAKEVAKGNEDIENSLSEYAKENAIKFNNVFMPLRVAITGSPISPPLGDILRLLPRETIVNRIEKALDYLNK